MAFTDFNRIGEVQVAYQIFHQHENFIPSIEKEPPVSLVEEFAFKHKYLNPLSSKAAFRENLVYPLLWNLYCNYGKKIMLWSTPDIHVDETLYGNPDYIFSARSHLGPCVLQTPILLSITLAENNDFLQGWARCLAMMVGAQKLNENKDLTIYGIVTDGVRWDFGKLSGSTFTEQFIHYNMSSYLSAVYGCVD
ncbi:MAG: hypothetical protein AAF639_24190 [Chloroflexota bacterium]